MSSVAITVTTIEGLLEIIEKQSTKQTRQNGDGQEEIRATRNPSQAVRGNAATRNHAMKMRMQQRLAAASDQDGRIVRMRCPAKGGLA
jgi:hypothetical protein